MNNRTLGTGLIRKTFFVASMLPLVIATSCSRDSDDLTSTSTTITNGTGETTASMAISFPSTKSTGIVGLTEAGQDTTDNIGNYTFDKVVEIAFSGTTAGITNAVSGVNITVNNGVVNIVSTASGVNYKISGTTSNGSVNITSNEQFQLTLNGASITNTSGSAINIASAVKAFVNVAGGTTNTLADTSANTSGSTFYSAGSLIFSGTGTLSVAGNSNDAIQADDRVRLTNATLNITSAVNDGIQAGMQFVMDSGSLNITTSPTVSYSKGVSVLKGYLIVNDGDININTSASAGLANQWVSSTQANTEAYSTIINGGNITITSTSSTTETEGIESNHGSVNINGGNLVLNVTDDAINGESSVNINGGNIYAYVTGNDVVDSNGTMYITGGKLVAVSTASAPETSLDSDDNTFNISGGVVVAITPGSTPSSPSASTQSVVLLGSGNANQIINVQDNSGNGIITFMAPASYSNIMISTPNLSKNTSYKVFKGGSVSGGESFYGLYTSGTYTSGTNTQIFTTGSSSYTNTNTSSSRGRG